MYLSLAARASYSVRRQNLPVSDRFSGKVRQGPVWAEWRLYRDHVYRRSRAASRQPLSKGGTVPSRHLCSDVTITTAVELVVGALVLAGDGYVGAPLRISLDQ
jgi:hypothetical protein